MREIRYFVKDGKLVPFDRVIRFTARRFGIKIPTEWEEELDKSAARDVENVNWDSCFHDETEELAAMVFDSKEARAFLAENFDGIVEGEYAEYLFLKEKASFYGDDTEVMTRVCNMLRCFQNGGYVQKIA